ncbi:MAG: hypothetical protein O6857_06515 [Nitrospinae bacterium]|nr:hypothetical protein [Nitrospinota bacterium]
MSRIISTLRRKFVARFIRGSAIKALVGAISSLLFVFSPMPVEASLQREFADKSVSVQQVSDRVKRVRARLADEDKLPPETQSKLKQLSQWYNWGNWPNFWNNWPNYWWNY